MFVKLAKALEITVGLSSLSMEFNLSIRSERSTSDRSWSCSFATQKAAVFLTYGSLSLRRRLRGAIVASTKSFTAM